MRPKHLKELLHYSIPQQLPVLVTGSPGIGKSDIVKEVVESLNYDLLITHPVVDEAIDYKGLPFPIDGRAEFLPYGNLRVMLEAERPTVIFVDDLGQADVSVQKAFMQLLLERTINGKRISDNIVFVGATNRQQDKAGVSTILEPVKSRFATIVNLEIHLDDWIEWAINNGMPADLISFIRFKPSTITKFEPTREIKNSASPRTIARVGTMLNTKLPTHLEYEVFSGAAGEAFAVEFNAFLKVSRNLPDPKSILEKPESAMVPTGLDEQYAITGSIAHAVTGNTFSNMITYLKRLPAEFNVMGIKDAVQIKGKEIVMHPAFLEWSRDSKNRELIFSAA